MGSRIEAFRRIIGISKPELTPTRETPSPTVNHAPPGLARIEQFIPGYDSHNLQATTAPKTWLSEYRSASESGGKYIISLGPTTSQIPTHRSPRPNRSSSDNSYHNAPGDQDTDSPILNPAHPLGEAF